MNLKTVFTPILTALFAGCSAWAQVQDYRQLQYPDLPEFKIPKPDVFTLENGLRVFLLEDRELPLITVNARVRTGSYYEPADKAGLAELLGIVQRSGGTSRQTGDQIDDFLAARAANIETGMGGDFASATMDCLKQDFDDVFALFAEILRTPAFAQDKLDIAKVSINTMIARRNDNVGQITSREIRRIVYGSDSPIVRQPEYASVKAVTRDDLLAWHRQFYHPNNILLGVVGDFDTQAMKTKIAATFAAWPKGPEFSPRPVRFRKEPAPGYYFIEKSDVNQANIAFGHLGIETRNPDYFAVQVMNEILGGGFASRMFSNVRSKQGLAYSVYGGLGSDFLQPGMLSAGLQTKLANTSRAIAAVRAELSGVIDTPPTADELKRAKGSILNSFVFNYDSKEKVLAQQMTYAFYGLPSDFLEQYRAKIERVQASDVTRVAKKYVHPDQLAILVVGKASDLDQPLSNLGNVTSVDISIPAPPDTTPKVEKSAEKIAAGKQLWAAVLKAMGGEAFKNLQSIRSTGTLSLSMAEQSLSLKQTTTLVFPDKTRQVITSPMGEQTIVLNGADSFMVAGGKSQPLPAEAAQEVRKEQARTLPYLLKFSNDPQLETIAAGQEELDGVQCGILAVTFNGVESHFWVGPDGRILKQSYQGVHPLTRTPGIVENTFSDFRPEGALLIPHKQTRSVDGAKVMELVFESFEANPSVDPAAFQKPAE